ncbi:MAG: substrate-binding domain-containing protein [Clostridiaceae bacterium]|jgi:inositol transport system substrate-binding protein|nr:substrate-binding domain-containing protein [Clostridiaceae bacterium]
MKSKAKWLLTLLLIISIISMSVACAPSQPASTDTGGEKPVDTGAPDDGKEPVVYFCISHMTNAWAITASESMEAEAKKQGANLTVLEAGQDINAQVSQVEMAVTNGADAIIIEPVSAEGAIAAIKKAEQDGVRVIVYNQNIADPSQATTFVGVSNADMGYMEMKAAIDAIDGKGNVVLLLGPMGSEGQIGRSAGYDKALKEYPDVNVVFQEDAQWTTEEALKLVENWISTGTEINAVVSQNDNMALGAIKAFEDAGIEGVPVYGVDAVDDALKAIKKGRLTGTVDQATAEQSRLAIEVAIKLSKGEAVEKEYLAEPTLIDINNIDNYLTE